jgi:hypothetical protein
MRTYILLEYKRDITITKLGGQLVTAASRDQNQDIDTIIAALEQMDPTKNKQYVEWLARQYIRGQFRLEDYPRVNDVLVNFEKIKNKLTQRDINQYTFRLLEEVIDKEFNVELTTRLPTDEDNPVETDVPGAKNLYNGPLGKLDVPMTEEAAKILGRGTKWCTAAEKNNMFDHYNEKGPLYVWRDKSGDKYQIHFPTIQFMDSRDNPISHEQFMYFRTKHPVLSKLFKQGEQLYMTDAEHAFNYAFNRIRGRWTEGENVIKNDPLWAYKYARDVVGGKWEEGEPIIASRTPYAYRYAMFVIKDRFPQGESKIASDPYFAMEYARDVMHGRFPGGEPTIMKSGYAEEYTKFLKTIQRK